MVSSFRPTCPRCWERCPPGSTRCPRDNTWLLFDPPPADESKQGELLERGVFGNGCEPLEAVA